MLPNNPFLLGSLSNKKIDGLAIADDVIHSRQLVYDGIRQQIGVRLERDISDLKTFLSQYLLSFTQRLPDHARYKQAVHRLAGTLCHPDVRSPLDLYAGRQILGNYCPFRKFIRDLALDGAEFQPRPVQCKFCIAHRSPF